MIEPKVSNEEVNNLFSSFNTLKLPSGMDYMRIVDQPLVKNKILEK
jgi:hypothetical protein